jgi:hypothetical protein
MAKSKSTNVSVYRDPELKERLEIKVKYELLLAQMERAAGFVGRTADEVADEMERVIAEIENAE